MLVSFVESLAMPAQIESRIHVLEANLQCSTRCSEYLRLNLNTSAIKIFFHDNSDMVKTHAEIQRISPQVDLIFEGGLQIASRMHVESFLWFEMLRPGGLIFLHDLFFSYTCTPSININVVSLLNAMSAWMHGDASDICLELLRYYDVIGLLPSIEHIDRFAGVAVIQKYK